jgi:hypothetical protein
VSDRSKDDFYADNSSKPATPLHNESSASGIPCRREHRASSRAVPTTGRLTVIRPRHHFPWVKRNNRSAIVHNCGSNSVSHHIVPDDKRSQRHDKLQESLPRLPCEHDIACMSTWTSSTWASCPPSRVVFLQIFPSRRSERHGVGYVNYRKSDFEMRSVTIQPVWFVLGVCYGKDRPAMARSN